tara:strand:+ start:1087 stop:1221 length:135 start_codon:yes stop_codon:yes gene_type:complete
MIVAAKAEFAQSYIHQLWMILLDRFLINMAIFYLDGIAGLTRLF